MVAQAECTTSFYEYKVGSAAEATAHMGSGADATVHGSPAHRPPRPGQYMATKGRVVVPQQLGEDGGSLKRDFDFTQGSVRVTKRTNTGLPASQKSEVSKNSAAATEDEWPEGNLVIDTPDIGDETEGNEPQELSLGSSEEDGLDVKMHRSPGWRKKGQQKMEHGRKWILRNFLLVSTAVSIVPLSSIEEMYLADCQRDGQEPLSVSVLARLIHQLFPDAGRCRLGPRGNQKIHYSKLQWRVSDSPQQENSSTKRDVDEELQHSQSVEVPCTQMQSIRKPQLLKLDMGKMNAKNDVLKQLKHDPGQDEGVCEQSAKKMAEVVKLVSMQGKRDIVLKVFAHSASCHQPSCSSLCLMFRRVRRHVVKARHACHILRIYSLLLKLHVATCEDNDCGLTACPAMRASCNIKPATSVRGNGQQQQVIQGPQQSLNDMVNSMMMTVFSPGSPPSTPTSPTTPPTKQPLFDTLLPPTFPQQVRPLSNVSFRGDVVGA